MAVASTRSSFTAHDSIVRRSCDVRYQQPDPDIPPPPRRGRSLQTLPRIDYLNVKYSLIIIIIIIKSERHDNVIV